MLYKHILLLLLCLLQQGSAESVARNTQPPQKHFITCRDATLYCTTQGKGPPLLIIHGGPGLSHEYLWQLEQLSEHALVIFYDQRGCGKSVAEITPETIHIATYIEDIEAIRKAFHFDKISILGHSWGGFLAMHYATIHPNHVEKLILSNTMPASSEDLLLFLHEYKLRTEPLQENLNRIKNSKAFQEGSPQAVQEYYELVFGTYCYHPETVKKLHLHMPQNACVSGARIAELIRLNIFMKPFSIYDSLQKLDIETLVIHGQNDPIPSATAKKIHESIRRSQFVVLSECGHFPYVEKPEAYFSHVQAFLNVR